MKFEMYHLLESNAKDFLYIIKEFILSENFDFIESLYVERNYI